MSTKQYKSSSVEQPVAPPRYQPPPQVNSKVNLTKNFSVAQHFPVKDEKHIHSGTNGVENIKPMSHQAECTVYYPNSQSIIDGKASNVVQQRPAPQYPQPPALAPSIPPSGQCQPPNGAVPHGSHRPIVNGRPVTDDELIRLGPVEAVRALHRLEAEMAQMTAEHHQALREVNRRAQSQSSEMRALKEVNQRLQDDNQELRDLCCFLDDDRQKGRKLAREWQRFGRYTASVMRQEVAAYQNKLRELDSKQQELIKDNLELKELCLYLDEERNQSTCSSCGGGPPRPGVPRDDGDGSSSSTNADEVTGPPPPPPVPGVPSNIPPSVPLNGLPRRQENRERPTDDDNTHQRSRSIFNDQIMQYIRGLEQKVQTLAEEKRVLQQKVLSLSSSADNGNGRLITQNHGITDGHSDNGNVENEQLVRPEPVTRALQVLEVREQLERCHPNGHPNTVPQSTANPVLPLETAHLGDGEKALVREMCNVVWRKLEEVPPSQRR
ncbi:coiled-coil domain-containing protein 85C [Ischnura elegans]|uniref:coiled-coil domain-containing protein 85C n=1 Tax=Ischnura elegans TaxID=197161 RepID=UPI001ED86E37|nr:coiled-coil domain-containing protein 85C [Ischnura elegans]